MKTHNGQWVLTTEDLKNCYSGTKISWLRKHYKTKKVRTLNNIDFSIETSDGWIYVECITEDELNIKNELSHQWYKNSICRVIGQYERELISNVESKIGRKLNSVEKDVCIGSLNRKLSREGIEY